MSVKRVPKLGQVEVKVWSPLGYRYEEKTTRNLPPEEFAEQLHDMRWRMGLFATKYGPPNAFAGLCPPAQEVPHVDA